VYKIIYAHDVHKANLLGNAQLQERERKKREREKREEREKRKKNFLFPQTPLHGFVADHRKERNGDLPLFFPLRESVSSPFKYD